jgi:pimeloyl-ACP methyl ester carboxylesterase
MMDLGWKENRRIRFYGNGGPPVIVLHGGPGGSGGSASVAQGLSGEFQVIEPWQRPSGEKPLSVAVHVADLHQLICSRCRRRRPALVGESWGAMLALAYAAQHPDDIGPIVLIGCGTFDKASRAEIVKERRKRILDHIDKHPEHRSDLDLSIGEQMMKWHEMTDAYVPVPDEDERTKAEPFDMKAHTETWSDMVRCQEEGIYPQSFASLTGPVLMLHGAHDPHPGKMIRDNLRQFIPQLEYREFAKCGHAPAIEAYAKEEFFKVMRNWLGSKFAEMRSPNSDVGSELQ